MRIDVSVESGKYRYTMEDSGKVVVYRNGDEWFSNNQQGNNMLFAFAWELQSARLRIADLEHQLDARKA